MCTCEKLDELRIEMGLGIDSLIALRNNCDGLCVGESGFVGPLRTAYENQLPHP